MQLTFADMGVIVSICAVIGGAFTWVIKAIIKPMQATLDNNTEAMEKLSNTIDKLDGRLDDHDRRIERIETIQTMHGCDKEVRK